MDKREQETKINKLVTKAQIVVYFIVEILLPKTPYLIIAIYFCTLLLKNTGIPFNLTMFDKLDIFLEQDLFKESRIENLINMAVIIIGFYITVISIFGVGVSKATVDLAKNGLSHKFIKYTKESLYYSVIYLLMTIFYDFINSMTCRVIYFSVFLLMITNFIRFGIIVIKMYENNIKNAYIEEKYQEHKEIKLMGTLKHIEDMLTTRQRQENQEEYFDNVVKQNQEYKKKAKPLKYKEDI